MPLGLTAAAVRAQAPIIVDHTCTDLSQVPANWIQQAKANLRVGYGHTSHGSQLVTGIEAFRGSPPDVRLPILRLGPGSGQRLDYWGNAGGAGDLEPGR